MPLGLAVAAGALGKKLLGKAAKHVAKKVLGSKVVQSAGKTIRSVAGTTAGRAVIGGAAFGAGQRATRGPGSSSGFEFGAPRRYRRMNAGNAKALRRAFRRVDAFGKLAKKYWKFARPKQSGPKLGKKKR